MCCLQVIGVAQVINKNNGTEVFTAEDEEVRVWVNGEGCDENQCFYGNQCANGWSDERGMLDVF